MTHDANGPCGLHCVSGLLCGLHCVSGLLGGVLCVSGLLGGVHSVIGFLDGVLPSLFCNVCEGWMMGC